MEDTGATSTPENYRRRLWAHADAALADFGNIRSCETSVDLPGTSLVSKATNDKLQKLFAGFGLVKHCVGMKLSNGASMCFAFTTFDTFHKPRDLERKAHLLDEKHRLLFVQLLKSRTESR